MKNIIYQYWDGFPVPTGTLAGQKFMQSYAKKIGVDYLFETNPQYFGSLGKYSNYYSAFKPVFDKSFDDYDYILFADADVIPIGNKNIFNYFAETFPDADLGICEEWNQPEIRLKNYSQINNTNDERWVKVVESRWGKKMPRTESGLPRVFNSGVVMYSRKGIDNIRKKFAPFKEYVELIERNNLPAFYTSDQLYLHAMLNVAELNWIVMDYAWNSSIHYDPANKSDPRPIIDLRTPDTQFVHIQLNGKHHMTSEELWRRANDR